MKKLFFLIVIVGISKLATAQNTHFPYYHQRTSLFELLPSTPDDIIFLGNSITNGGEWIELLDNKNIKNRGINADIAQGVYDRLDQIIKGKPAKIFLLIGINDLSQGAPVDSIVSSIGKIIRKIKTESPSTLLYIQSLLPVNDHFAMYARHVSRWAEVPVINKELKVLTKKEKVTYVDLFSHFKEKNSNKMDIQYTNDGLHLMGNGYLKWVEIIRPYIEENFKK